MAADKNIENMLLGWFGRSKFERSLGCGRFDFDPRTDLRVAHGQNDPGLYTRAGALLQPFAETHKRVVVVMDAEWEGSPGPAAIRSAVESQLERAGWGAPNVCAVVIEPEIENWVWQDNPHVYEALGVDDPPDAFRRRLKAELSWPEDAPKPIRPKELMSDVLRSAGIPRSAAIYKQIAGKVSARRCTDPAFIHLRDTLRSWFPRAQHDLA